MRTLTILLGSSLLLAVTLASGAAAEGRSTSYAARLGERIEAGNEAARSEDVKWGTAVGVVNAPAEEVARVLTRYARYDRFMPHFKKSRVLSRRGDDALVYMEAGIIRDTVTLWAQMRISARTVGDRHIVEGRMQKGNMDAFQARWEITPVDDNMRSLVRFRLLVDPGLPLPDSVFDHENKKSARKAVRALREHVRHQGVAVADNR